MKRPAPIPTPLRGLLAAIALTAAAAPRAHAQDQDQPPPPARASATGGSLVTVSSGPFGETSQLVYSLASDGEFPFRFSKTGGGSWRLELRPGLDVFIKPNISVGGIVHIGTGGGQTTVGLGARVGYNVELGSAVSLWLRGGLSFEHQSNNNAPGVSVTTLNILVPFLFHFVPHFFLGVGPFFDLPLTNSQAMANKDPTYGLTAIVGGYF
jgi:hypothetical protein